MALNLSIAQMLAQLEAKVALHGERKDFHADQEAIHREQMAAGPWWDASHQVREGRA